jgi:hypothetical protein
LDELNQLGLESVFSHLESQGVSPRIVEGSVLIENVHGMYILCRCEVVPAPSGTHSAITPVGIEVSLIGSDTVAVTPPPHSIRELLVGLSHDPREGVVQATHTWCAGVFPPIYRACDPNPASEDDSLVYPFQMATQDIQTGAVQDWDVFLGPPQLGGPNADAFISFLNEGKLMHLMMNPLTTAAQDVRMHWVKVYVAFQPDGSRMFECKLDNDDFPEGVAALQNTRWPRVKGFVQYRQFLVMRPSKSTDPKVREHLAAFTEELQASAEAPTAKRERRRSWWPFGR